MCTKSNLDEFKQFALGDTPGFISEKNMVYNWHNSPNHMKNFVSNKNSQ